MNAETLITILAGQQDLFGGMKKLERYAGLALVGLCARSDSQNRSYKSLALEAVDQAAAIVEELKRRESVEED